MGSTGELLKMYFPLKTGPVHVLLASPWFPNGLQRQTSFISQKKIKNTQQKWVKYCIEPTSIGGADFAETLETLFLKNRFLETVLTHLHVSFHSFGYPFLSFPDILGIPCSDVMMVYMMVSHLQVPSLTISNLHLNEFSMPSTFLTKRLLFKFD